MILDLPVMWRRWRYIGYVCISVQIKRFSVFLLFFMYIFSATRSSGYKNFVSQNTAFANCLVEILVLEKIFLIFSSVKRKKSPKIPIPIPLYIYRVREAYARWWRTVEKLIHFITQQLTGWDGIAWWPDVGWPPEQWSLYFASSKWKQHLYQQQNFQCHYKCQHSLQLCNVKINYVY